MPGVHHTEAVTDRRFSDAGSVLQLLKDESSWRVPKTRIVFSFRQSFLCSLPSPPPLFPAGAGRGGTHVSFQSTSVPLFLPASIESVFQVGIECIDLDLLELLCYTSADW